MATDKVVIGRKQSRAPGDNPVPVMVGVAGKGDLEAILQVDQPLHRIGRGRVHADLAVPIDRHETEGRIDGLVDDREVQPVALGNRPPVVDPGAAERIDPQADLRAANGVHVDHIAEIARCRRRGSRAGASWRREEPSRKESASHPAGRSRETRSPSPRSSR